jgi:hypothetical protein
MRSSRKPGVAFARLAELYKADGVAGAADGKADTALSNIRLTSALDDAVADADLVIEAVPEILDLKLAVYGELGELAPARTIFATNSSTLPPATSRPARAGPIVSSPSITPTACGDTTLARSWARQTRTPRSYAAVVEFAKGSGLVPIGNQEGESGIPPQLPPDPNAGR